MPRRNKGRDQYEPLDLTPEDVNIQQADPQRHGESDREWANRRADVERKRADRQRAARVNRGIDWTVCLVPGCGKDLRLWGRVDPAHTYRDHRFSLPLCLDHTFVVFRQAKSAADEDLPVCVETNMRVKAQRQAIIDAAADTEKQQFMARTDGHLYIIRQNDLIKVGWSRDIHSRVRGYGAGSELLAVWPGTRSDETNLHRQLGPARAKGREWYEDGPIMADLVKRMVEQYGEPTWVADTWTRPKQIVAGKHHR
jgi:hypothetical protein